MTYLNQAAIIAAIKIKAQCNKRVLMRTIKNVLNIALNIGAFGTRLISKKQIYSYFIFLLFIILLVVNLFAYGSKDVNEPEPLRRNFSTEITNKIKMLEEKVIIKAYENLPNFVNTLIAKIPKNLECRVNLNWMPGIYFLLSSGGESIIFYDSTGSVKHFQYFSGLKSELSSLNIDPSTLQVFSAFSETTTETQLKDAYLKMKEFGIKRIKIVYAKDNTFVEKNAFNPQQIIQIKQTENKLISLGMSPSDARTKAKMPLLNSCPTFLNAIRTISGSSYDDIKVKIINEVKNHTELQSCNIQNVIDYCLLTYCSRNTYGIVEIDINDFENEAKKALQ